MAKVLNIPTWSIVGALAFAAWSVGLSLIITLPWETQVEHSFTRDRTPVPDAGDLDASNYSRRLYYIDSWGTRLECWIYLPKGVAR